jgi:hypothetical protein
MSSKEENKEEHATHGEEKKEESVTQHPMRSSSRDKAAKSNLLEDDNDMQEKFGIFPYRSFSTKC